jgi:hypothetical protein
MSQNPRKRERGDKTEDEILEEMEEDLESAPKQRRTLLSTSAGSQTTTRTNPDVPSSSSSSSSSMEISSTNPPSFTSSSLPIVPTNQNIIEENDLNQLIALTKAEIKQQLPNYKASRESQYNVVFDVPSRPGELSILITVDKIIDNLISNGLSIQQIRENYGLPGRKDIIERLVTGWDVVLSASTGTRGVMTLFGTGMLFCLTQVIAFQSIFNLLKNMNDMGPVGREGSWNRIYQELSNPHMFDLLFLGIAGLFAVGIYYTYKKPETYIKNQLAIKCREATQTAVEQAYAKSKLNDMVRRAQLDRERQWLAQTQQMIMQRDMQAQQRDVSERMLTNQAQQLQVSQGMLTIAQAAKAREERGQKVKERVFLFQTNRILTDNGFTDGDKIKWMMEILEEGEGLISWSVLSNFFTTIIPSEQLCLEYLGQKTVSDTPDSERIARNGPWKNIRYSITATNFYKDHRTRTIAIAKTQAFAASRQVLNPEEKSIPVADLNEGRVISMKPAGQSGVVTRNQKDSLFQDAENMEKSAYQDKNCLSMMPGPEQLIQNVSMWTVVDEITRSENQRKAENIFSNLLLNSNFLYTKDVDKLNSSQIFWLYRWMGPLCSIWRQGGENRNFQNQQDRIGSMSLYNFVSDVCRARFAFLKSMLAYSLLFPFIKSDEAKNIFEQKSYVPCLDTLDGPAGNGKAILILDDCYPGRIRIIGKNVEGKNLEQSLDVFEDNIVNIKRNQKKELDTREWAFDPIEIISTLTDIAQGLGVNLVANTCWKVKKYNKIPNIFLPRDKVNMEEFPKSEIQKEIPKKYKKARQSAISQLADLTLNENVPKKRIPKYIDVPENTQFNKEISKDQMNKILTVYDKTVSLADQKILEANFINPLDNRETKNIQMMYNQIESKNIIDASFKQYVIREKLMMEQEFLQMLNANQKDIQTLKQSLNGQLDDNKRDVLYTLGLPKTYFDSHNVKNPILCQNGNITVNILHYAMINPVIVTGCTQISKDYCEIIIFIGDSWFLQPLISKMKDKRIPMSIQRFKKISNSFKETQEFGNLDIILKNYTQDGTIKQTLYIKNYVQDVIYTGAWASLIFP